MSAWTRPLDDRERRLVAAARLKAWTLYAGVETAHRSCGISLAETFGLPTRPYQSLRKGGLRGLGPCGAMMGGQLVLGEVLGDPDPTGRPTEALLTASAWFDEQLSTRVDRARARGWVCNDLTGQFKEFSSPERAAFCTRLATEVATLTAEALVRAGALTTVEPVEGVALDLQDPIEPGPPMPALPGDVAVYRTVRFTDETVPMGLLAQHQTKEGVWARVEVQRGALWYRIRGGVGGVFRLEPGKHGVIRPQELHEVGPIGQVAFSLSFLK